MKIDFNTDNSEVIIITSNKTELTTVVKVNTLQSPQPFNDNDHVLIID